MVVAGYLADIFHKYPTQVVDDYKWLMIISSSWKSGKDLPRVQRADPRGVWTPSPPF